MIPGAPCYDFYDKYSSQHHVLMLGTKVAITGIRRSTGEEYTLHILDGKMHRTDGPALVFTDGESKKVEYWAIHDELHRTDGPAIVDHSSRRYEYYLYGEFLLFGEWAFILDLPGPMITQFIMEYPLSSDYNPYI